MLLEVNTGKIYHPRRALGHIWRQQTKNKTSKNRKKDHLNQPTLYPTPCIQSQHSEGYSDIYSSHIGLACLVFPKNRLSIFSVVFRQMSNLDILGILCTFRGTTTKVDFCGSISKMNYYLCFARIVTPNTHQFDKKRSRLHNKIALFFWGR